MTTMGADFRNRLKDGSNGQLGHQCEGCDRVFDPSHLDVVTGLCDEGCHDEEMLHLEEVLAESDPRNEYTFLRDAAL